MTLWRGAKPLILASQSASRQALLGNAGLAFQVVPSNIDERSVQIRSGLKDPGAVARYLACEKAQEVAARFPGHIVIGADQTLALGDALFSKPAGRTQAAGQLKQLAGRTHELHSAVAIVRDSEVLFQTVAVARLTMRALSDAAIGAYLDAAGDKVTTSVGAYQLEGLGIHLFEKVEGDHFTVLGMPLPPLLAFFRKHGRVIS